MQSSPRRALFVDDEESIRLMLSAVLEQNGFNVRTAASVDKALVELNSTPFDVLVCDLNIEKPGDGFVVLSAMRHVQPDCVNLILTGYPGLETALQAIHEQVDEYLVKPTDIELLLNTIEKKLAARALRQTNGQKTLSFLLKERADWLIKRIEEMSRKNPANAGVARNGKGAERLSRLLSALAEHLQAGQELWNAPALEAAAEHGRTRKQSGFSLTMVVEEYELIERAVHDVVRENLPVMSIRGLVHDIERFHDGIHQLMKKSLQAFNGVPHKGNGSSNSR